MAAMDAQLQDRIRQYASETRSAEADRMEVDSTEIEARLDDTIQQLQDRVKEQQLALEQLLASSDSFPTHPSSEPRERLRQLRTLKTAYKSLTESPPSLPPRGSALPSIIATQIVQNTIDEAKQTVAATESQVVEAAGRVEREEAALADARRLADALGRRIELLREQREQRSQQTAAQVARDMLETAQEKKREYRRETQELQKALGEFVDEHLAAMLAAEELGGPVVGNMMDVDEDVLMGGFSSQGKARKATSIPEDRRQQRIDQIWGSARNEEAEEPASETKASAQEVKDLFEALFEALVNKDSAGPYVELNRDSAASRFLVRAKVAQFHPKDARKLRLVDFGRELDD